MKAPKPGETIALRRGQNGQGAGLHLLHEVLEDGRLDVTSWRTFERFKVPIEDVVGWDGEPVTLDARRPAPAGPVASRTETPPRLVKVIVVNRKHDIEITRIIPNGTRHNDQVTTRYKPGKVVLMDRAGQPHVEFEVDSRDLDKFLVGVPDSYLASDSDARELHVRHVDRARSMRSSEDV